ncbi:PrsW family intramembrane metalloprotease [Streptomyces sp. NPDC005438]|uniref:PrsW family intramembrane metalloprotease n=1 Tax=Streptomyces sp. NPDC005438 TaxID=3156880 RepID=UPI0033AFF406
MRSEATGGGPHGDPAQAAAPDPYAPSPYAPDPDGRAPGLPGEPGYPPPPGHWGHPSPTPTWWHRRRGPVRLAALVGVLALCGVVILGQVREQTGTEGLVVGLLLSLLPVPLLVAGFRWVSALDPVPWRQHGFAFAWGACGATLVAMVANTSASLWLGERYSPAEVDSLGSTLVAPVVEELVKAVPVALLYLVRPRQFTGPLAGLAAAGICATGFAFTENILYLGMAYDGDQTMGGGQATAVTFFVRICLSPFAHPLFAAATGIGLGLLAAAPADRRQARTAAPVLGLLVAMALHSLWNGTASGLGFLAVYGTVMTPLLALLVWWALWTRRRQLRTVRAVLPLYAAAGWLGPLEPWGLSVAGARSLARSHARQTLGPAGAREVAAYQRYATALALLRDRMARGVPEPDFPAREGELLHDMWRRHGVGGPATAHAARLFPPPGIALAPWGQATPYALSPATHPPPYGGGWAAPGPPATPYAAPPWPPSGTWALPGALPGVGAPTGPAPGGWRPTSGWVWPSGPGHRPGPHGRRPGWPPMPDRPPPGSPAGPNGSAPGADRPEREV